MSLRDRHEVSRRTVLRGLGVTMGLPFLEAMGPLEAFAAPAPAGSPPSAAPVRLACLFMPNGVNPHHWTPEGTGASYRPSEILTPLAPVRDDVLVLTNLMHRGTKTGDGHYVKTAAWLTGTTITKTTGSDLDSGGVSLDQLAAQKIGHLTALPSLELAVDPVTRGIDANVGYTRIYGSHISWSTPTTPVAREINPRLAFDRLFRASADPAAATRAPIDRSVLDLVQGDAKSLQRRVGAADKRKLDEYLDSVRAIEKRIAFEEKSRESAYREDPQAREEIRTLGDRLADLYDDPGRVAERRLDHTEHVRLMLDIMVLGFWTNSTRIATFMFGNAVSGKNFSFLDGVGGGHHQISHHENDERKLEEYKRINRWHVEQYVYMLDRMRSIREGDGTLLDNSMVLFGSGLRDGNSHNPHDLPILLGGRAGGRLSTGRHVAYEKNTPLCNLYTLMLRLVGAPAPRFGDSTGELPGLEAKLF